MSITVRPTVVTVRGGRQNVVRVDRTTAVRIAAGVGPRGPAGPSGAAQDSFDFTQASPALQWSISHNLGRRPIVELFSVGGAEIEADVIHLSNDQVIVNFVIPTAGSARLI
jgi:hypothetical protein